ncbi:class I SAM-dependent methyltransferase [Ferruginibacter sp.]|uniref:class I SAM-dependent methyltransferase n=1 Tax=Ferruginibacter sp. TaxID=1940288 RepID=UPI0019A51298|nr:class I SAM-dependent methyltransferase [Ferruginibacter sp.]MBC7627772.1 class I SAM-dependent methyltransferase [Ferruginibacter sp.]
MVANFNTQPIKAIQGKEKPVYIFEEEKSANIDEAVVSSFGEEWLKFSNFNEKDINQFGDEYFDITDASILNKNTYALDMGCGSGRFSRYLSSKVGFIEVMDPSEAIWAAEKLLCGINNVRMINASADSIPFNDNTFDLVLSIGVLHHIPDTQMAMQNCVSKVKPGGYFFVYLYYNLDNRGFVFRFIFKIVNWIRKIISSMPSVLKKLMCDLLAVMIYVPIIFTGKVLHFVGLQGLAKKIPLSYYQDKSFFIIRNDALDRFGTRLEHRFSKAEIQLMMETCGLINICFSDNKPYWHAIGKKDTAKI